MSQAIILVVAFHCLRPVEGLLQECAIMPCKNIVFPLFVEH